MRTRKVPIVRPSSEASSSPLLFVMQALILQEYAVPSPDPIPVDANLVGGREVTAANYEVLGTASVNYVRTGSEPILSGALVGGREGTRVLYICQAAYNNGTHPR
jgi:hypothetical protein